MASSTDPAPVDRPDAPARKPGRRGSAGLAAGLILGGLLATLALLNLDRVEVNWIFGTWSTPLILVIAVSFAAGLAAGTLVRPLSRGRGRGRRS